MNEIQEKLNRKAELEAELEREQSNGSIDPNKIRQLTDSINLLANQIAELNEQANQQAQAERIAATTQASIASIEDITIGGIQLSALIGDEDAYMLIKTELEQRLAAQASEFQAIIDDIRIEQANKIIAAGKQNAENVELIERLKADLETLTKAAEENAQYQDKYLESEELRKDAEAKRDAAVAQLEEAQKEIEELRSKLISGATYKPAEQAAEQAERLAKIKRERFTIYDLKPDNEFNPKNYTAKLALTGEEISFNWTAKPSYTVINENEVLQFREANGGNTAPAEEKPVDVVDGTGPADISPSVEVPQFPIQEGDGTAADGLDQHPTVPEVVGSVEDRLSALEQRVAALESSKAVA